MQRRVGWTWTFEFFLRIFSVFTSVCIFAIHTRQSGGDGGDMGVGDFCTSGFRVQRKCGGNRGEGGKGEWGKIAKIFGPTSGFVVEVSKARDFFCDRHSPFRQETRPEESPLRRGLGFELLSPENAADFWNRRVHVADHTMALLSANGQWVGGGRHISAIKCFLTMPQNGTVCFPEPGRPHRNLFLPFFYR
jgi:hypothetical protein